MDSLLLPVEAPARSALCPLRLGCAWLVLLSALWLAGCASPRALLLSGVADALAAQGQDDEDDLWLARDAAPFYLKLSESVLREDPAHPALAQAVSSGFSQYAYAFVAFEADRLEATDARAALELRERAARMYRRAQGHALRALQAVCPAWMQELANPGHPNDPGLKADPACADAVGLAHWGASAWAARISLSKHLPDVAADLPKAVALAQRAYAAEPDHAAGALASLMGSLEAARPGGSIERARQYFERAQAAGRGRNAGVFVAMAESLAQPAGDRAAFQAWLRTAVDIAKDRSDIANRVMGQRAQWLLETADDRF